GERSAPRVAARTRLTLHRRHAEESVAGVRTATRRRRMVGDSRGAGRATGALGRWRRNVHPVPQRGAGGEGTGDAGALRPAHRGRPDPHGRGLFAETLRIRHRGTPRGAATPTQPTSDALL